MSLTDEVISIFTWELGGDAGKEDCVVGLHRDLGAGGGEGRMGGGVSRGGKDSRRKEWRRVGA